LRPDKKLLVLDLDHTLFDFGSRHDVVFSLVEITRPGLEDFLVILLSSSLLFFFTLSNHLCFHSLFWFLVDVKITCYQFYDIVIWSQTSWDWVEVKLTGKFHLSINEKQTKEMDVRVWYWDIMREREREREK
jgi:ubiquitin-like domain-containing CTD phosphatase 1